MDIIIPHYMLIGIIIFSNKNTYLLITYKKVRHDWCQKMSMAKYSIKWEPFVDLQKVLMSPVPIIFDLMKQCVSALDKKVFKESSRLLSQAVWGKSQSQCLCQTIDKEKLGLQGISQEAH